MIIEIQLLLTSLYLSHSWITKNLSGQFFVENKRIARFLLLNLKLKMFVNGKSRKFTWLMASVSTCILTSLYKTGHSDIITSINIFL